ncbi:MAG: hypothetical protein HPY83_02000 [Anaerolineae bacterium]|nr:hypothetical protein [Anaerolineae bacterium]
MLVDIHVHTTRHSSCARSSPDEMMEAAEAAGLDAVVITEHHFAWEEAELDALRRSHPGLRIFRGMEITTDGGRADVLAVGMADWHLLQKGMPPDEAIRRIREAGGLSVLAHPFRLGGTIPAQFLLEPPDAYEAMSLNMPVFARRRAGALDTALPSARPLAASDAHHGTGLGSYAIQLEGEAANEAELVAAVASGAFRVVTDFARLRDRSSHWERIQNRVRMLAQEGASLPGIRHETGYSVALVRYVMEGGDLLGW